MKKLMICCLSLICCSVGAAPKMHTPPALRVSKAPEGATIRVKIGGDLKAALLEVKGGYKIVSHSSKKALSAGSTGKRYVLHPTRDGIRFGEEFPDMKEISIVPTSSQTDIFLNGFQYKGEVHIYLNENRKLLIVNEIPIERYLTSKLAVLQPNLTTKASREAFAILERTKAIQSIKGDDAFWDVVASECGYYGHGVLKQTNGLEKAVEWTPFMVLGGNVPSNLNIPVSKIEELALMGFNAKEILKSVYPTASLGIAVNQSELAFQN